METQPIEKEKERKFPLEIVYNGTPKEEVVSNDDLIQLVIQRAIHLFHVTQQPHVLALFNAEGDELVDGETVGHYLLTRKTPVFLRQSKVKGG
jgi:hypothetical protein